MDPEPSTSQIQPPPPDPKPKLMIQWQSDDTLADVLVTWLTKHPPDCHILFYSDGKKPPPSLDSSSSACPSGKDKSQIYSVITQVIFECHAKYGLEYANSQKKFHDSVNNRITSLKNKYKPLKAKFSATGAGVVSLDDTSAKNLQEEVCRKFPWYKELDAIWHSNPSFAAKTTSSKPGVDHAGDMYMLVCPRGRAGPSAHAHTRGATRVQPPSHVLPPHSCPFTDSQIDPHLLAPAAPAAPAALVPSPAPAAAFPHFPALPIPPAPPAPPAPPNADFDTTMGNVPDLDDDDLYSAAFHAPLGNALDHLDDDDMDTDAPHPTYDLNSPPKVARKKRQLPSSPSPHPNHPIPFSITQKSPTPFYNSCAAFGAQGPSGYDT
ncbi:hypothetical protein BDR06DRAFT_1022317 [Suillus hirtellus]|nr:hypothetical protein BDR06DRAFT_1022317 [Suillus hirtellus]